MRISLPVLSRLLGGLAALALACDAMASWSADGKRYVVSTETDIALIDMESGRIAAAFPRNPKIGRDVRPAPAAATVRQLPLLHPSETQKESALSADGKRLAVSSGALHVWNVETGTLEMRMPDARPLAWLGERGEHLALIRRLGQVHEFLVWDMAGNKPIASRRMAKPEEMMAPLPTGSHRLVAFSSGLQREVWVWSQERRALERLPLPEDFAIVHGIALSGDGKRLALAGSALKPGSGGSHSGGQLLVFEGPPWRKVQAFATGSEAPRPVGWTRGGEFLIATASPDLLQFDARSGALRHRWKHVSPIGMLPGRGTGRLRGGQPSETSGAVLSPAGDRLAMIDQMWGTVLAWDATSSPPNVLPEPCPRDACGSPSGMSFSPSGGSLLMFEGGERNSFWRMDFATGVRRQLMVSTDAIARAALSVGMPAMQPGLCASDLSECVKAMKYVMTFDCSQMPERQECMQQLPYTRAACAAGADTGCSAMHKVARRVGDTATQRLAIGIVCNEWEDAAAARAAEKRKSEPSGSRSMRRANADPCEPFAGVALTAAEVAALRADCTASLILCDKAAHAAAQAGDAALAVQLAGQGCEAGLPVACLAGGRAALRAGLGRQAQALFEDACYLHEEPRCLAGLRDASRLPGFAAIPAPAKAKATKPATVAAPDMCGVLAYARVAGVRAYENGEFAGIRIRAVAGESQRWPFRPGDVLLNSVRCDAGGCSSQDFMGELNRLCGRPQRELPHDLLLQVRSADPARNRDFLLRAAGG